jgi:hypothetical protein
MYDNPDDPIQLVNFITDDFEKKALRGNENTFEMINIRHY